MQVAMRPPILTCTSIRTKRRNKINDLKDIIFEEDSPIWKCGTHILEEYRNYDKNYMKSTIEVWKMRHIAYQLPPCWAPIIEDIWIKNRPTDAVKFLNLLEEAERYIHPLWMKLENDPIYAF